MSDSFSLSDIVQLAGAKRRSVQLWADGGILVAAPETDRLGTGVHRRFSLDELRIAALLTPLAKLGAPIGILKRFAGIIRQGIYRTLPGSSSAYTEVLPRDFSRALLRAQQGQGANYLTFFWTTDTFHMDIVTDEEGPIAIDPAQFLAPVSGREALGILDLTALLSPLSR